MQAAAKSCPSCSGCLQNKNQLSYYHESLRQNEGKGMAGHQAQGR